MKEYYEELELEVIVFDAADVITTSPGSNDGEPDFFGGEVEATGGYWFRG